MDSNDQTDAPGCRIYVLRSRSEASFISEQYNALHMILVTDDEHDFKRRMANAPRDPVFLKADVEIAASYALDDHAREDLETQVQRVFDNARATIATRDDLGRMVRTRKWFHVPLYAVEETVERIRDRSIADYIYDPKTAALQPCRA